jgi:carboxymethylenebutenolidase
MPEIRSEWITLNVADGTTMRAYVARPRDMDQHTGLLLYHEAFGVNAHIRDVAERLAREGFVTVAPELFHRTAPGFEAAYSEFELAKPHVRALTDQNMEADVRAAYEWLHAEPGTQGQRIACMGFCMGGRVTFLANAVLPVSAAISFYGGGIAPNRYGPGLLSRAGSLHAPQMLLWGGLDKHVGPDQTHIIVEALRAAGKPFVNVEFSDADHGFFCDARSSFNTYAARQAWVLVLTFLKLYT